MNAYRFCGTGIGGFLHPFVKRRVGMLLLDLGHEVDFENLGADHLALSGAYAQLLIDGHSHRTDPKDRWVMAL